MSDRHPTVFGRVLHNVTFRGFDQIRLAEQRGESLNGVLSMSALQDQVRRDGLIVAGVKAEMQLLKERAMAVETTDDVRRQIDSAATRISAARPTITHEEAVSLALDETPALYDKYLEALSHEPAPVRIEAAQKVTAGSPAMDLAIAEEQKLNPKLTREQAFALALDRNPQLYEG